MAATTTDAQMGQTKGSISPTIGVYKETYTWVLDTKTNVPVAVRKSVTIG